MAEVDYTARKTFVLCFDGTGNKFSGTDSDSNILKIFRMLDRSTGSQFHYYQPGIGTYVTSSSLDNTTLPARIKSWYDKAKDSAVGSSFANHVMGGYRFLMRYYTPGDDIYFFGFSRGAYTARFLAEMLDHVGLLSAGNEELCRFAWKTFSKWQARRGDDSLEAKEKEADMYTYMKNFRETFSRPVRRIRFLGLFDTVNSVPRFENAWMQRSKFPYTARSSAKVIRHAVSINERRAKFRQDLITGTRLENQEKQLQMNERYEARLPTGQVGKLNGKIAPKSSTLQVPKLNIPDSGSDITGPVITRSMEQLREEPESAPSPSYPAITRDKLNATHSDDEGSDLMYPVMTPSMEDLQTFSDAPEHPPPKRIEPPRRHRSREIRKMSLAAPMMTRSTENLRTKSRSPRPGDMERNRRYSDHTKSQDIEEVWFPGGHADIGGGWPKEVGKELWPLSHAPLVWMVQEAEKAGLEFDQRKMTDLKCCPDKIDEYGNHDEEHKKLFHAALSQSATGGFLHDCLQIGGGLPRASVLSWKIMEYLPFRRMDLKDGNWVTIRWPLPGGETRDMPDDAKIHVSAIKRMQEDPKYRPGNLIVGGGGRGVKTAPEKYGIGEWEVFAYHNDPVKETYIRKPKTEGGKK